jgi:hypothetical protein
MINFISHFKASKTSSGKVQGFTLNWIYFSSNNLSAYDAEFDVLAQELGVPLLAMDNMILTSFPGIAVSLSGFVYDKQVTVSPW